ncbi:MAG: hypothetical protein JSW58_04110 [Candidatus Latescibacterota bacterium]|nr:MAG: hypothetical protein JSW58_04110 [Candidatus Latescibacterota bacterium]
MSCRFVLIVGLLVIVLAAPVVAQEEVLIRIEQLDVAEIKLGGFILDRNQEVSIEAVGFRDRGIGRDFRFSNAWILDAESRKVVWTLREADSERLSKHLREYTDEAKLSKGRYEVYYSTYPSHWYGSRDVEINGFGDLVSRIMEGIFDKDFNYRDFRRAVDEFYIVVRGNGNPLSGQKVREFHNSLKENAFISLTALENDHYESIGLTLERPMDLQIYAIGEITRDGNYDYCWITDTRKHEKVWKFEYENSAHAGGAKKNRVFKGAVSLPKGTYAVYCATDDSHAFDRWNSPPPHDPFFWGVVIQPADPKMAEHIRTFEHEHIAEQNAIVEITRLGDDEMESQGFTIKRPMRLRVYAIGEGGESEMYDFSWIVDAETREPVWEMEPDLTEHAGGASKNRVFEGIIELEPGNYIAYAVTDDSHSYRDWNASPPHDQERWGITIVVVEGERGDVVEYSEDQDRSILARIVGVGNNSHKNESFELADDVKVRIYAIGEGSRGEMYDYAWIENSETGDVVWEMTYRMTDHAGGAKKNRLFNGTLVLEAGEYIVHYESDGSHSFRRWNASPPADAMSWGVTVKRAGGK